MKLSDQLKQDHVCGDYGVGLEGYSERAKTLEDTVAELQSQIEFKIKECQELAQACQVWKKRALINKYK